MINKLYCSPLRLLRAIKAARWSAWAAVVVTMWTVGLPCSARGADAPQWMHAVVNAPLPAHDEKTDAVLLYSEDIVNVQGNGKIKSIERRVYKILRPGGREHGRCWRTTIRKRGSQGYERGAYRLKAKITK